MTGRREQRGQPDLAVSWYSPPPPDCRTVSPDELAARLASEIWATGLARAAERPPSISVDRVSLCGDQPGVVSLAMPLPQVGTRMFRFSPDHHDAAESLPVFDPPAASTSGLRLAFRPTTATHIRPAGDLIKLEDRLFYVLQPPIESLLASQHLDVPHCPFPYQLEGVAFLYPRHSAVLADEMGLGKTMQAITAIRLLAHAGELRSVLLVCPKPLVGNWLREFRLWAPELPVAAIEGEQTRRQWQWQQEKSLVKLANYELLHRDGELLRDVGRNWDLVVLDESQRIKNRASTTSQIVRSIPRTRSWALTGTPIENSADDLVGIFEFLSPGYLSPQMKPRRMGRLAGDYLLRRTKAMVLEDLPPKLFRDAHVHLTSQQQESYRTAEEQGVLRLAEMGSDITIQHVFELVLRLKQICNFDPATGASTKLDRLDADLEEVVQSGQKAIVFSQWVRTLGRLEKSLARFRPLAYHGKVPPARRDDVIRRFRDDPDCHVLLVSYGAGGVGLNLQFAGYVFLFDRWWNPAVEDQAINRAHRIGAAGPVTVTRFLALGTIEERIDQILKEKREIFDAVLSGAEPRHALGLTQQEIFGLFQLRGPAGPIRATA